MGIDRFGPTDFVVGDIKRKLPRAVSSRIEYRTALGLKLNRDIEGIYIISPFVEKKTLSKEEANILIRTYIWNTFFKISKSCKYNDNLHWSHSFCVYMQQDLRLDNVYTESDVLFFIGQVRNAVFRKMVFVFDPPLVVAATNTASNTESDIVGNQIKINNPHTYIIADEWYYWSV